MATGIKCLCKILINDLTNLLIKCGVILSIYITNHIIVTEEKYLSFADNGIIEELKNDKKYMLSFMFEKQMKEDMEKRIIAQQSLGKGKKWA